MNDEMGALIALLAVGWAWVRTARTPSLWPMRGVPADAFWLLFGVLLGVGSVSQLFIVLVPLGLVLLGLSWFVDPAQAWLTLVGTIAVPVFFLATETISGGAAPWIAAGVGSAGAALVAAGFQLRDSRLGH